MWYPLSAKVGTNVGNNSSVGIARELGPQNFFLFNFLVPLFGKLHHVAIILKLKQNKIDAVTLNVVKSQYSGLVIIV
jgi:hypothetical protein